MRSIYRVQMFFAFVCTMAVASNARAELVYGARGTSDTAVAINQSDISYAGAQSNIPGPPRQDLLGSDISMGSQYAFIVDTQGSIQQLDKSTLSATGLKTDASTGWDYNDIFISVDVGVDGYLYAARYEAAAVKIDPVTLTYAGAYTQGFLKALDISVGSQYAYMVDSSSNRILQLWKDTLQYTGLQTSWGGGDQFISVDVGADGYVYAARSSDTAVRIDPLTLAYTGKQTLDGPTDMLCRDISMGSDYGFAVRNDGYIIQLDKNTLAAGNGTAWPSGGNLFVSVDVPVNVVPEPSALALLAMASMALVAYAWRKRK